MHLQKNKLLTKHEKRLQLKVKYMFLHYQTMNIYHTTVLISDLISDYNQVLEQIKKRFCSISKKL